MLTNNHSANVNANLCTAARSLILLVGTITSNSWALEIGTLTTIVPSENLPSEATVKTSNNNLDVVFHQGELYFAWRTSTSHFASSKTLLHIVKQTATGAWQFEKTLHTGKDLREPRFLSLNGELFLYFAELGTNPIAFQPGRTLAVKKDAAGNWGDIIDIFDNGFIPWRINNVNGEPVMIGYRGGENIYQGGQQSLELMLLTTHNGLAWEPAFNESGVVLESGVSETDFIVTDDYLLAVGRNEAGDDDGWGSKICRAEKQHLADWHCVADPRKFDSPLLLNHNDNAYLIARRQVAYHGKYDLGWRNSSFSFQNLMYQAFYWLSPKRCAIWQVNPQTLTVDWLADLPSAGDTCFPSAIENDDGSFDIYNYSSDPEQGAHWSWIKGQLSPTQIYKINVTFP